MAVNRTVYGGAVIALLGLLAGLLLVAIVGTRDAGAQDAGAQDLASKAAGRNGPERVYALTRGDDLLRFDGDEPGTVRDRVSVNGLGGDSLVGVDFRPANGLLYGVSRGGGVYLIRPDNGRAQRVSTLRTDAGQRVALQGQNFDVDFNPTVDRLRIVSDADQNLRANVGTGETIVDGDLRYGGTGADPRVTAVAYENSRAGAFGGETEIYYLETNLDRLTTAADANSGVMSTVGGLRVAAGSLAGFDIVTRNGMNAGYAALQPGGGPSGFYNVDRSTGQAKRIGPIGNNSDVESIAIPIGQR